MKGFTCVINIRLDPYRQANTRQEFIDNLLQEYNEQCYGLLDIKEQDLKEIEEHD